MSVTTPTIITAVSITTYSDNRAHCIISHLGPTPDAIPPHTGNPDFLDLLHQSYPCTNEISLTHTQLNQPARTDLPPATKPEFSIFFWNDNRTELDHDHLNKIAEAWYHQQKAWHTFTDDLDSTNNASQVVTIPEPEPPLVSESATPTEPATPSPKNDILGPRPGEPPPWSRKAKTQAGLQPDAPATTPTNTPPSQTVPNVPIQTPNKPNSPTPQTQSTPVEPELPNKTTAAIKQFFTNHTVIAAITAATTATVIFTLWLAAA